MRVEIKVVLVGLIVGLTGVLLAQNQNIELTTTPVSTLDDASSLTVMEAGLLEPEFRLGILGGVVDQISDGTCPQNCMMRVPTTLMTAGNLQPWTQDSGWECVWPSNMVSRTLTCPSGWNGGAYMENQTYEIRRCGVELTLVSRSVVGNSPCTREINGLTRTTACPAGWTGSYTEQEKITEVLDQPWLVTNTRRVSNSWVVVGSAANPNQVDCTREGVRDIFEGPPDNRWKSISTWPVTGMHISYASNPTTTYPDWYYTGWDQPAVPVGFGTNITGASSISPTGANGGPQTIPYSWESNPSNRGYGPERYAVRKTVSTTTYLNKDLVTPGGTLTTGTPRVSKVTANSLELQAEKRACPTGFFGEELRHRWLYYKLLENFDRAFDPSLNWSESAWDWNNANRDDCVARRACPADWASKPGLGSNDNTCWWSQWEEPTCVGVARVDEQKIAVSYEFDRKTGVYSGRKRDPDNKTVRPNAAECGYVAPTNSTGPVCDPPKEWVEWPKQEKCFDWVELPASEGGYYWECRDMRVIQAAYPYCTEQCWVGFTMEFEKAKYQCVRSQRIEKGEGNFDEVCLEFNDTVIKPAHTKCSSFAESQNMDVNSAGPGGDSD